MANISNGQPVDVQSAETHQLYRSFIVNDFILFYQHLFLDVPSSSFVVFYYSAFFLSTVSSPKEAALQVSLVARLSISHFSSRKSCLSTHLEHRQRPQGRLSVSTTGFHTSTPGRSTTRIRHPHFSSVFNFVPPLSATGFSSGKYSLISNNGRL